FAGAHLRRGELRRGHQRAGRPGAAVGLEICVLISRIYLAAWYEGVMRITIVGAGGVGGYFGAKLAKSGCEVGFVARGAHLAFMRRNGLLVESQLGDIHLP